MEVSSKRAYRREIAQLSHRLELAKQGLYLSKTGREVACHLEIIRLLVVRFRELYYQNPRYRGKDQFQGMKARAYEENLLEIRGAFLRKCVSLRS